VNKPLSHQTVLVTRAKHQASDLCDLIKKQGGKTINVPSLEIIPLPLQSTEDSFDIAIFLSANAVIYAKKFFASTPNQPIVIAIGSGTARALTLNHIASITPKHYSSEGLLKLKELENPRGKRIGIFCGQNPRPLLKKQLIRFGADVFEVICYKRQCPQLTPEYIHSLNTPDINFTVCSSHESLINFHQMLLRAKANHLLNIPLIVIHPKYKPIAEQLGFTRVSVAYDTTPLAIVESITLN
jgi:uroporphyrinogen-III synthase